MNTKTVKKSTVIFAVLFVLALTAVAVSALVISNTLTIHSSVQDSGAVVSEEEYGTLPADWSNYDLLPDSPMKGVTYKVPVKLTGVASLSGVVLHVSISKTGISSIDLIFSALETDGSWEPATFTDNGDILTVASATLDLYPESSAGYFFLITFSNAGEYDVSFWVEG